MSDPLDTPIYLAPGWALRVEQAEHPPRPRPLPYGWATLWAARARSPSRPKGRRTDPAWGEGGAATSRAKEAVDSHLLWKRVQDRVEPNPYLAYFGHEKPTSPEEPCNTVPADPLPAPGMRGTYYVKVPFKVVKYKLVPYTAYRNVSYEVTEYQKEAFEP